MLVCWPSYSSVVNKMLLHESVISQSQKVENPFYCVSCICYIFKYFKYLFLFPVNTFNWIPTGGGKIQFKNKSSPFDMDAARKHKCNICLKSFKKPQHLEYHRGIHTGEKSFICPICFKTFRLKHNLDRHKRSVHKTVD
ncbi:unnamed protein product [Owenia fusiformis]|uniref:Uncharacterized protein n=1 Tax=Owenia fusiformis TaxID=6347 RepID=A0A8J1TIZ6_OWEFU|nr:unnamed protein product [Owenia fusiformis]